MRYAVIGSALSGNKGAAAMLESAVQQLSERDAEARFVLLSMYPRSDAEQNPYPTMRVVDASPLRLGIVINSAALLHRILPPLRGVIRRAVPQLDALVTADVLLDQGGITFVDGRGKYLLYNVASILPALLVDTPVVKCAQAMGPFRTPINGGTARALLPRMAAIISRGAVTHEHLLGLGLTNVHPGADLAFTLDVTAAEVETADAVVSPTFFEAGGVIGVSPSAVLEKQAAAKGDDYVAEVARMIDHITQARGQKVLLVAHSARARSDKTHNNDLPLCREIHARLAAPDMVAFPDGELSSQALRHLIGRCEVFVASRFHAMVSSLAMGVPTLVIGWSHKYREVLDMFGLADWAVPHESLTDEIVMDRISELVASKDAVRARLREALPGVRTLAEEQLAIIQQVAAGGSRTDQSAAERETDRHDEP